ncbi:hypothetical protein NONO_c09340 [Nocardia nova SH22a]|uniref:Uncharacterized protein n=1 Tax=Nocardia nova SH22a TaxID=1415166 RepID=W5TES2_9NOCA|nr:hypothetical protein [Nocardia nova]AHH15741.1 hypothetical protein NONO_c09340 [Nocardia nova SH22a]
MDPGLDRSIVDLLRRSAMGSIVDRPVNDVLRDMGLPGLPQLPPAPPLPQLPPLPVLDLHTLTKPITDLASSFGTGNLGSGPGQDPTQVLSQVSSVLQTVVQLGSTAMQLAMTAWQGAGALSAASKSTQAAADGTAVAGQGAQMSAGTVAAAGSVFTGNVLMTGITSKYLTTLAAAAPFIVTPPGQVFVLSMSAQTLAEALGVVTKTRVELGAHSAKMAHTGHKVKITNVPHGVSKIPVSKMAVPKTSLKPVARTVPSLGDAKQGLSLATTSSSGTGSSGNAVQYISQALQMVQSLSSVGGVGAQAASALTGHTAKPIATSTPASGAPAPASGGGAPAGGGAPGPAAPEMSSPLQAARTPSIMTEAAVTASAETAVTSSGAGGPGMMPMSPAAGAAGMARAASDSSSATDAVRGQLVNAAHGNDVVGDIAGVSLPVVGAADAVTTTPDTEPPDKALTL